MGRPKKNKVSPGQLAIPGLESVKDKQTYAAQSYAAQSKSQKRSLSVKESATAYRTNIETLAEVDVSFPQISIYVGITFDLCQGIREFKQRWYRNQVSSIAVFNCKPLEMISLYTAPKSKEIYALEEFYISGKGGLLSNAVFLNILRVYDTLAHWSRKIHRKTGIKPIEDFEFITPDPTTDVGKLWNILGMNQLTQKKPNNIWLPNSNLQFHSRIVTPFLIVNDDNMAFVRQKVGKWLDYIYDRIDISRIQSK